MTLEKCTGGPVPLLLFEEFLDLVQRPRRRKNNYFVAGFDLRISLWNNKLVFVQNRRGPNDQLVQLTARPHDRLGMAQHGQGVVDAPAVGAEDQLHPRDKLGPHRSAGVDLVVVFRVSFH